MIRLARNDLSVRLDAATGMLNGFLADELSESHIGIPSGTRAHLERFRSFLMSHYTARFGQYPPQTLEPGQYATMRHDFEALYKLLADETYSSAKAACGGICTLQLVQIFDAKHGYKPLDHILPRLPELGEKSSRRHRMPWRSRIERRLRPDQKMLAHAALIKASNRRHQDVFHNDLAKAYRAFEEDSVFATARADSQEKVSLVDARKVRWILIYATYQVLRSVTDIPSEVFDAHEAPYHVAISTQNLPPWPEPTVDLGSLMRRQTDLAVQTSSPLVCWADSAGAARRDGKIEIKPDIDYFALTHGETTPVERTASRLASSATATSTPSTRSSSVARGLTRNATIRRSMRMFKPAAATTPPQETVSPSKPVHHEILVQGYGNGLNYLSLESGPQTVEAAPWAVRNNSTASNSSSSPDSTDSGETLDSTVATPTTMTTFSNYTLGPETSNSKPPLRSQRRDVVSMLLNTARSSSLNRSRSCPKRPVSSMIMPTRRASSSTTSSSGGREGSSRNNNYWGIYEQLVEEQRESFFGSSTGGGEDSSGKLQPRLVVDDDDWAAMQAFMDGNSESDVKPAWEQYADLGGLTEMR